MDTPGHSLSNTRRAYLATLTAIRPVIASREVGARWEEPSALAEFSVRGLAGHLVRSGLVVVDTYLDRPAPTDVQPVSPAAYYAQVSPDITSPPNVAIRQRGEELAAAGPEHRLVELDRVTALLQRQILLEPDGRLLSVANDVTMRLDDYLVTRLMELTVHADDLAVSVGLAAPSLPLEALEITICALLSIARYRHGDLAVLRAFSRRERQSADILCVF